MSIRATKHMGEYLQRASSERMMVVAHGSRMDRIASRGFRCLANDGMEGPDAFLSQVLCVRRRPSVAHRRIDLNITEQHNDNVHYSLVSSSYQ